MGLLLLLSVCPLLSNLCEPNFKVKSDKQYLKKDINLENVYQNCSVAMPQHVPQSLPNPPCVECLFN